MQQIQSIALFGAGHHGATAVLPAILKLQERNRLRLVGIVEPAEENQRRACISAPDLPVFSSAAELYSNCKPDIAYISTLPHLHESVALEAFSNGCHVVCEKPLAPETEACRRMIAAAERADRHLVTMFENRYKPHYSQIRSWILSGKVGRVECIHLRHFWPGPVHEPRRTNLLNASGALDCGIHYLDLARFFVDGGEWERIYATGQWFDEPHLEKPPHIDIVARLVNGPTINLSDSMSYRIAYGKRTGDRSSYNSITVLGTEGVIQAELDRVILLTTDGSSVRMPIGKSTHADEIPWVLEDLLSLIHDGVAASGFLPDGRDGLIAQHATEQANQQANAVRASLQMLH
ncbi:hypothetical protein DB346_01010 [Verrucomicrobia bacterium LW23]|nr:hypothetical protein DB346_01010 [Verrucomicrobia bacterium LW23]